MSETEGTAERSASCLENSDGTYQRGGSTPLPSSKRSRVYKIIGKRVGGFVVCDSKGKILVTSTNLARLRGKHRSDAQKLATSIGAKFVLQHYQRDSIKDNASGCEPGDSGSNPDPLTIEEHDGFTVVDKRST